MDLKAKKSVRELRKHLRRPASDVDLSDLEMFLLIVFALGAPKDRGPDQVADAIGMRERKVRKAWSTLCVRGLITPLVVPEGTGRVLVSATAEGQALTASAVLAVEIAGFEPHLLSWLHRSEAKAPFPAPSRTEL